MAALMNRGRPAHTEYRVDKEFRGFSLLEVKIKTGRTHQIRVHLSAIGHPVVGDDVYGERHYSEFVEKYGDLVNIREFKAPDLVLHSKIMMIDQRLVTISSVNLNNRSFFHDSENGMVVLDPAFYRRMKPIYDDYLAHSQPVATNVSIGWVYRLLFSNAWVRQAF